MAKRRVNRDDDEDVQDASPVSKRARNEDTSDVEQNTRSQPSARNKGKARAHERDSSDDEDQDMEEPTDNIDDEDFEEQYHETVDKAVKAKRQISGGVAEHGIIESIEMHHFMCHRFLSFAFGPQINFIIGHNGSGKSAVLSAITVALGGKSNSTGRGSGLKSFIREGESAAEVTIALKNQGEEAFKPQEYGKSIFITRRFTKEGNSTWKIRGAKHKNVLSTKREELSAICDHMNIQVDNPMNVLTQDAARQFLSASAPADKYKFFLRGTQLSQLATEYETCLENITNTTHILKNKKDAIPDLRQAYREATAKYQEAAQALKQKERARELKTELAWAHVRVIEKDLQKEMEAVEAAKRHLTKIEESLSTAKDDLEKAGQEVQKHEDDMNALGEIDDLLERRNALKEQMKANRTQLAAHTSNIKEMSIQTTSLNNSIQEIDRNIAAEMARMAQDTQEKRDTHKRKVAEAEANVAAQEEIIQQNSASKLENQRRIDSLKKEGEEKEAEMKELREKIVAVDNAISQLQRSENNKYAAYGPGMAQVVGRIQQMKWYGDVPLGPLGTHVKVKDPDAWADLLAQMLRPQLTSFAITDPRDREPLKKLLDQANSKNNTHIIIYEKDNFDFSQGEPAPDVLTVMRAIEIDNPLVTRLLVNSAHIEAVVLAHTRQEAEQVLRRTRGGFAWTRDLFIVKRFPEGGGSTNPMSKPERSQMLRNEDTATRQRYLNHERVQLDAQHEPLRNEVQRLRNAFDTASQEKTRLIQSDRRDNSNLSRAKTALQVLYQEANEDTPVNVQGLQDAKTEAEQERAEYARQFEDVVRQKEQLSQANSAIVHQESELRAQISSFNERAKEIQDRVTEAAQARMTAQQGVRHYEKKAEEAQASIKQAEVNVDGTTEKYEEWVAGASQFGERVETNRKPEDVQRQMDNVKHALQERERKQGASVDDIVKEVNTTKEKYERAQKDYKSMLQLNKILKQSLYNRLNRWQEFRRHIALRCKMVFRYNLAQRGYFGNIMFDHSNQTLSLKVQTDDQVGTQDGSKEKDPRSLSGGEKSFSTICLLLSLWESIGCPLRCLDEFDVFMDAVNRRISMKMMIDTANQSDKKQYILITPQDMTNIKIGPSTRVHRMTDPERGQGILAMN
ncbi:P-loop containing nucleoside triphosphate hydrolase protein [Rhodocollybia butyracea]|uniref:P-loop containing nucleoside triphosphate hydrolase protein n=1 Tax=Rhodocollybia butyracea TaxID=206335 RepID=A0A9P5Q9P6_9AGAR|nr:P-loop containing nucleoside triphosphate hydrolase protein [Rhodocollybia butyracea]